MAVYTTPGVYIEEIPSGVRTIMGVSTSTTAFVGRTLKGPAEEPTLISSFGEFATIFGGLWDQSPLSFSVQQFFGNGGQLAIIVRLANGATATQFQLPAGAQTLALEASSPGAWGDNLRIAVDTITKDPTKNLFNLTVTDPGPPTGTGSGATEVLRNLSVTSGDPRFITSVLDQQSRFLRVANTGAALVKPDASAADQLVTVAIQEGPPTSGKFTLTLPWLPAGANTTADIDPNASAATMKKRLTDIGVASSDVDVTAGTGPGNSWVIRFVGTLAGQQLPPITAAHTFDTGSVSVTYAPVRITTVSILGAPASGTFTLVFPWLPAGANTSKDIKFDATAAQVETAIGALVAVEDSGGPGPNSSFLLRIVGTDAAKQVGDITAVSSLPSPASVIVSSRSISASGTDGIALDTATIVDANGPTGQKGMYALEKADLFNLLVLPPPQLDMGQHLPDVWAAAATYCQQKRAFLIVDPPAMATNPPADSASAGLDALVFSALSRQYSGLFFPRFTATNPLTGLAQEFTPSGAIAGIMARTDANRGVWKAPAGLEAGFNGILELSYKLTDAEIGTLNQLGVNCLRSFRFGGPVVWGARTLDGNDAFASEWKYIPVRRLALFIEESLFRGTQWVVFEPNDEPLWSQIRLNLGAFMHDLFRQGAFQGSNPRDAYFVKCDSETTTLTDINSGVVNVLVGFAPLKPAEFVVIQIQQMAGQVQA
jgi:phage tail sheath protein FI